MNPTRPPRTFSLIRPAILVLVLLATLGIATSCDLFPWLSSKVYIAGYYGTSSGIACYWLNGTRTDLPSAGFSAEASSIALDGSSVIVAGYYKDASNHYQACSWRDGIKTDLAVAVASNDIRAMSVFVSGGFTYHAGFYYDTALSRFVACSWKNGVVTPLTAPGTEFARADDIHVEGLTVRVVGFHAGAEQKACLWTNGTRSDLPIPAGATHARAYSVYVDSGHVYISGYYRIGGVETACIWVDSVRTDLSAGSPGMAIAIHASAGTIRAAGYLEQAGTARASLWTGGTQEYPSTLAGHVSEARGIDKNNKSVYVCGFYANASDIAVACLWTDGTRSDLPSSNLPAFATAIVVN